VHAATPVIAPFARRLRRVETDADCGREPVLLAVASQSPLDVDPALERIDRLLECDEEPVAGVVGLLAAVVCESGYSKRIESMIC
jgi:hypothetical protein